MDGRGIEHPFLLRLSAVFHPELIRAPYIAGQISRLQLCRQLSGILVDAGYVHIGIGHQNGRQTVFRRLFLILSADRGPFLLREPGQPALRSSEQAFAYQPFRRQFSRFLSVRRQSLLDQFLYFLCLLRLQRLRKRLPVILRPPSCQYLYGQLPHGSLFALQHLKHVRLPVPMLRTDPDQKLLHLLCTV